MECKDTLYKNVIHENTEFLTKVNRSSYSYFTDILRYYLDQLNELLLFDSIVILQPLLLTERLETFFSGATDAEETALRKRLTKFDLTARTGFINSIHVTTVFNSTNNNFFSLFDDSVYKQVVCAPIYNLHKEDKNKGGLFFLNKKEETELGKDIVEIVTIISETITSAYNNYRNNQLYRTHYNILQKTQISSNNATCIYTYDGIIIFANQPFVDLVNLTTLEILGHNLTDILKLKDHHTVNDYTDVSSVVNEKLPDDSSHMYVELIKDKTENIYLRKIYNPILLEKKWFRMILLEDIAHELKNIDKIEFSSYHDSLTGLKNRNYFQKNITNLNKKTNLPMSVIVGDINGLKLINDIFSHAVGDEMICKISTILENNCKKNELYRIGGDEFYVFLFNSNKEDTKKFIEDVHNDCIKEFKTLDFVSISLGYHIMTEKTDSLESAISRAEADMYYMKSLTAESIKNKSISSLKSIYKKRYINENVSNAQILDNTKDFASYLNLREAEINDLCQSIDLLDIGKVAINYSVMGKQTFEVDDEFENMKKHCRIGYKIASLSYETSHLARIILNHHENWDGSGFPQGLQGKRIPYLSRIIRIIAYCGNLSFSNPNINTDLLINEIETKKGKLFDPVLADLFISYLKMVMKREKK